MSQLTCPRWKWYIYLLCSGISFKFFPDEYWIGYILVFDLLGAYHMFPLTWRWQNRPTTENTRGGDLKLLWKMLDIIGNFLTNHEPPGYLLYQTFWTFKNVAFAVFWISSILLENTHISKEFETFAAGYVICEFRKIYSNEMIDAMF